MSKSEAFNLATQLGFNLPARGAANALSDLCLKSGYKLGFEHATGDWVVWSTSGAELARCA